MDKMDLFVTGTVMSNRIPAELRVGTSTAVYKSMDRGDYQRHRYSYIDDEKKQRHYGLVAWKDSSMVYLLTSNYDTTQTDICYRRVGSVSEPFVHPAVIGKYNLNMGGVDLADMKRLHCNSNIMGQNRWWLKLFFYNLDVGTSNALILYNLANKNDKELTVVDYKMRLVMAFLGSRLESVPNTPSLEHEMERVNNRYRCAFCALNCIERRTRFVCCANGCNLPLCVMGSGKKGKQQDKGTNCFALSHANETILKATQHKHQQMMKSWTRTASSTRS